MCVYIPTTINICVCVCARVYLHKSLGRGKIFAISFNLIEHKNSGHFTWNKE